MKKYKILKTCWGFMGRMWNEGEIVELPDDATPPKFFSLDVKTEEKISKEIPALSVNRPVDIMKPTQISGGHIKPMGGFAASFESSTPKTPETAGQVFKKRGRPKK